MIAKSASQSEPIITSSPAKKKKVSIKSLIALTYSTKLFFYCVIWLMVLVVLGTFAQVKMGLFLSQETYFSSWFFQIGFIPFPGGRLVLTIMFFNLLSKLLLKSPLIKRNIGIIISHFGALVLLGGGGLTAWYSIEGNMVIPEGQGVNYFEDYHYHELVFTEVTNSNYDEVISFSGSKIKKNAQYSHEMIPGNIKILEVYQNCIASQRETNINDGSLKGLATKIELNEIPVDAQEHRNIKGMIIELSGFTGNTNGTYYVVDGQRELNLIEVDQKIFQITLRKKRYYLQFTIELLDFKKELYPGTSKPKSYQSKIMRVDASTNLKSLIEMNKPYRNGPYTFYQSSYFETDQGDGTILAVVKNYGRMFPYISSIIICIGLFVHLVLRVSELKGNKK